MIAYRVSIVFLAHYGAVVPFDSLAATFLKPVVWRTPAGARLRNRNRAPVGQDVASVCLGLPARLSFFQQPAWLALRVTLARLEDPAAPVFRMNNEFAPPGVSIGIGAIGRSPMIDEA